jgi:transposase-like protein
MALDQSALLELLDVMRSADGGELMRRLLATILQPLVDAEASAFIGAEPHERSETRTNLRSGTRDKLLATATGDITVKIPKVRSGTVRSSVSMSGTARPSSSGQSSCAACVARAARRPAGHLRRPPRPDQRHRRRLRGCCVAMLPSPFHAQRPRQSQQGSRRDGRSSDQNDLTQPTGPGVREHVEIVAATLDQQFPAVAALLRDAREEITAFADFPEAHRRNIWSTNPWSALTARSKDAPMSSVSSDDASLLRLSSCVLIEAHDEWQVSDRRYLSEQSWPS